MEKSRVGSSRRGSVRGIRLKEPSDAPGEVPAEAVLALDRFGDISEWNSAAERIFGLSKKEVLGKPITALLAEDPLRPSGRDFQSLASTATPIIYMLDAQGRFLLSEGESLAALGFKPGEVVGRSAFEIYQDFPLIIAGIRRALAGSVARCTDSIGSATFDVLFAPRTDAMGYVIGVVGMGVDVTKQRQAEASLSTLVTASLCGSGSAFFKQAVEALATWLDMDCVILGRIDRRDRVTAVAMYMDGRHVGEYEYDLLGTPCKHVDESGYREYGEHLAALFPEDEALKSMGFESYVGVPIRYATDTACRGVLCALSRKSLNLPTGAREVFEAIAARAATELAFDRSQTALRMETTQSRQILSAVRDGFVIVGSDGLIRAWNPAAEALFGWSAEEVLGKSLAQVVIPARRREAHCDGFASLVAGDGAMLPQTIEEIALHRDGREIPVEMSITPHQTNDGLELSAFVRDISERKRTEQALREHVERTQRMLGGTIAAMSKSVEARDPYTAGHQSRTANLACAIGRELGWDDDRVRGLFYGAEIHDIGKIGVPAEILSKPGRLTEIELAMVRTHPQVGYDIVKSIDFPWPVADMVFQHHERMDGSGYPQGLTGDAICMEARVLAVADVIKAMWSHRPYRPAPGIMKAQGAIEDGRGELYDPDVVDACERLLAREDIEAVLNPKTSPSAFHQTKINPKING